MHRLMIVTTALLVALASLIAVSQPALAAPQPGCFDETGFCIDDRFRQYWEQNGGLPVFGYPISSPYYALNPDTGQRHLTQWFERNRLEWHPENAAPYDVLLGRLGDELLRLTGINWQSLPRESGPRPGCLWFEQTGRNVCDQGSGIGIKSYWQRNGLRDPQLDAYGRSLALFGLPLTEARTETNASGDTVLTQWFERARIEWHPDKPDQFKVLLGLLGGEYPREPETGPPGPDPCANVPPPREMFIEPNCVRRDGVMIVGLSSLEPNQAVEYTIRRQSGETVRGPETIRADAEGRYRRFVTPAEWQLTPGDYVFVAQTGQDGAGPSTATFRVLP